MNPLTIDLPRQYRAPSHIHYDIWWRSAQHAEWSLRDLRFNPSMTTVQDLADDYAACQANAIGWASR